MLMTGPGLAWWWPPCFDSDVAGGGREGESSDSVRPGGHVT